MKTNLRNLFLVVLLFMTASISALAGGGGTTYYFSKVSATATPTGAGLVYVNTDKKTPAASDYKDKVETIRDSESQEHTYYLFASPAEGQRLEGWYSDADCSQPAQTKKDGDVYSYTVHSESTNSNARNEFNLFAKFTEIVYLYSSQLTVHVVGAEDCAVNVAGGKYGSEVSASVIDSPDTEHSYTVSVSDANPANCIFEGWYADEACTELLSTNKTYTYNVTTSSVDPATPDQFRLYAKFEAKDLFQLRNNSFEEWETVNGSGEEPVFWSSFGTVTGSMTNMVRTNSQLSKSDTEAYDGQYCARISARSVVGVVAQGNMTTGCINGGSMSATDANGNYNYTNEDDPGQSMIFMGRPDAMKVWVKSSCAGNFKIAAYLHEKGYFQDPVEGNTDRQVPMVGSATLAPESNNLTWTEYTVPFQYVSKKDPYYALVSFATNNVPGKGNKADYLFVDKVTMVYNSELASAVFNGTTLSFTDGAASVEGGYSAKLLKLTSNGVAATITTDYDEESRVLTITVKGQDHLFNPENVHVYTITFSEEAVDPVGPEGPDGEGPIFPISFDENADVNNDNDRQITYIALTAEEGEEQLFEVEPGKVYNNLTDEAIFEMEEGVTASGKIGYNGNWMHGYFYIDLDGDRQLSYDATQTDQTGTEVFSYSFWSGDLNKEDSGYNSLGEILNGDARNTVKDNAIALPAFTVPAAGEYKVRFKVDWNSVEPAGSSVQDIIKNGGFIVDATLKVKGNSTTGFRQLETESSLPAFDLQGRRVNPAQVSKGAQPIHKGLYIQNGRKIIR